MHSYTIKNFLDFVKHSDFFDLLAKQVIFRGQPVQGSLLPSIARADRTKDTEAVEKASLESLRLLGASLLPDPPESELDLMVRAQHFGLETRLLDWTANPLAALWFACADSQEGDAFVYALVVDDLMLPSSVYSKSPFLAKKTRALQPRLNNPRVVAQHGWFTLHRYSKKSGRFVALEKNPDTNSALFEYRIPAALRAQMLVSLDRHGISSRTLFPDMLGLCQYLNWRRGVA